MVGLGARARMFTEALTGPFADRIDLVEGGHGGGDVRMLADLFGERVPDGLGRAADAVDGARSLVTGLAANRSLESSTVETLLDEMEAAVPSEELAAVVAEVNKTQKRFGAAPLGEGGVNRVVVPAEEVVEDRTVPPTLEEFKRQLRAFAGIDFGVHSPR